MSSDADVEDYGFDYSDEEQDEKAADIENKYYNSKALLETDPGSALSGFAEVIEMEDKKGDWGFRALKQTVKLYYHLADYESMLSAYRETLTYTTFSIPQNKIEKFANKVLHLILKSPSQHLALLQALYQATSEAFEIANNKRLWFNVNLKFCNAWLDMREYGHMNKILPELYAHCDEKHMSDDLRKSHLLELYAMEIQMYLDKQENEKLRQLHLKALSIIKPASSYPRIMGIIHECGGKVHMAARQLKKAAEYFFNAFKEYEEAGNNRRYQCLKYFVLVKMLIQSEIDPFDSKEAMPYKNNSEMVEMANLVVAYQCDNIQEYENIIKRNWKTMMGDPFMQNCLSDLSNNIRTRVLMKLIRPYTRIQLSCICQELNISQEDVEQLLVTLVLDHKVSGQVDQVNQVFEQNQRLHNTKKRYDVMDIWNGIFSRFIREKIKWPSRRRCLF